MRFLAASLQLREYPVLSWGSSPLQACPGRSPNPCFPYRWPHFGGTKQRDRWTCPETRHFQGIFQLLGAAPLVCSPSQRQTALPRTQRGQGEGSVSCWVTFLSVCRTAPQTLEEPCAVSSYQLWFLWAVRAEQACETETRTWNPLVLGRVVKALGLGSRELLLWALGRHWPESPETSHHTPYTMGLLSFHWYSS